MGIMASLFRIALLFAALSIPLVFADAGPGPAVPKVTIHMMDGGKPAESVTEVTYHCMGVESAETGAVNPYPVGLQCTKGVCTNDGGWYYKFNPCFNFPEGHLTYEYNGKQVRTENVGSNKSYENHDITVDAPTGQISGNVNTTCNLTGFVLAAVLGASLMLSRK